MEWPALFRLPASASAAVLFLVLAVRACMAADGGLITVAPFGTSLTAFPTPMPSPSPVPSTNILQNPSFESGISPWYLNTNNGAGTLVQDTSTAAAGIAAAKMAVTQSLGNIYDLCAIQPSLAIGNLPDTVTFYAKADSSGRQLIAGVSQGYNPWSSYQNLTFDLSTSWQQYSMTYPQSATDSNAEILLCSGQQTGTVWFDLVSVEPASAPAPVPAPAPAPAPAHVGTTITLVDTQVSGSGYSPYGTFGSHNQKVISNSHGIFLSYLHSDYTGGGSDDAVWRLARSTDGSASFQTIYEEFSHGSKAPPIETDANDNVYAIVSNLSSGSWQTSPARFFRFDASKNYQNPTIASPIPTSAGKYAMEFDPARQVLYYFTWNNNNLPDFFILDLNGNLIKKIQLWTGYNFPRSLSAFVLGTKRNPLRCLDQYRFDSFGSGLLRCSFYCHARWR
jgi:hypothetical protein